MLPRFNLIFAIRPLVNDLSISMDGHGLSDVKTSEKAHESLKIDHIHRDGRGYASEFSYFSMSFDGLSSKKVHCKNLELQ